MTPPVIDEQVDVDRLEELYREQNECDESGRRWVYLEGRIDEYIAQNAVSVGDVAEAKRRALGLTS